MDLSLLSLSVLPQITERLKELLGPVLASSSVEGSEPRNAEGSSSVGGLIGVEGEKAAASRPATLTEWEDRILELHDWLGGELLGEIAEAQDQSVKPEACKCGGRWRSNGRRSRTLETRVGVVTVCRKYYKCTGCNGRCFGLDQVWGIESGCMSPGAKALAVDLATTMPFREAQVWLERMGRVGVSVSTVWRAMQRAGVS